MLICGIDDIPSQLQRTGATHIQLCLVQFLVWRAVLPLIPTTTFLIMVDISCVFDQETQVGIGLLSSQQVPMHTGCRVGQLPAQSRLKLRLASLSLL